MAEQEMESNTNQLPNLKQLMNKSFYLHHSPESINIMSSVFHAPFLDLLGPSFLKSYERPQEKLQRKVSCLRWLELPLKLDCSFRNKLDLYN